MQKYVYNKANIDLTFFTEESNKTLWSQESFLFVIFGIWNIVDCFITLFINIG